MARVNHKLVKQRLNEKRSKITDKQFFSSRMLAGHFEDLAAAQTRRYHYNRRVRVNLYWKPKDAFTAATDNMQIRINTGHPLVTKVKGRENRYQIVCGMFAHELGHVLFTDFLSVQTYHNYLDSFNGILARRLSGWQRMPGMRKRSGNMSRRIQRICRWSIRSRRTLPISLKTGISKIGC